MIENYEFWGLIATLIGGFGAVIALLLSFRSELIRVSDKSEQKDDEIETKVTNLTIEFRATHCKDQIQGAKE
jgi:uncharacterized YccA/Bax inhibitor family protein